MIKMTVSDKFKKFAFKTTKGKFDEARKAESMATGCPLPIGTSGVAVVGDIVCNTAKDKEGIPGCPMVTFKLEVDTPEEHRGTVLKGSGLTFWIKDSANQTEAESWGRMLDLMELFGLPREIRTQHEYFQECLDWFIDTKRLVDFTVEHDDFKGNKSHKTVSAAAHIEEGDIPTADGGTTTDTAVAPLDPNAKYVTYLEKPHKVVDEDADTYDLIGPSGRLRTNVPKGKTTPIA